MESTHRIHIKVPTVSAICIMHSIILQKSLHKSQIQANTDHFIIRK